MENTLLRNNVRVTGRGTVPMVFAHGFGCDQNLWRAVAPAFEEDHKVILFDYVGSGRSDLSAYDKDKYGSLRGYVQDLLDVIHSLELREIIFVGHSVSGMVGMLASIQEPSLFKELILVGPSARYLNDAPDYIGGFEREDIEGLFDMMDRNYIGWANFLAPMAMGNPDSPEFTAELRDAFCSTDPVMARNFAVATFYADNRKDLPKVTVPSLIMQCSDDIIAPLTAGKYLARNLPNSTFVNMIATGHCPQVSHPKETITIIKNYLDGKKF